MRLKCHKKCINGVTESKYIDGLLVSKYHRIKKNLVFYQFLQLEYKQYFSKKNRTKYEIKHIPQEDNTRTYTLSRLFKGKDNEQLTSIVRQIMTKPTVDCMSISVEPEQED